jgi:hypothetical protein
MTADKTRLEDDAPDDEVRTRVEDVEEETEKTRPEENDPGETVREQDKFTPEEELRYQTFEGKQVTYRVLEEIEAEGTEADVYVVQAEGAEKQYFLKYYRRGIRPKTEITEMLERLNPEHVVRVFETGDWNDRSYEIQEFIPHGSLANMLSRFPGGLPDDCMMEVLCELLVAVEHLHECKVIHRDLKPANIMIRTSDPLDLVLTDFGIASQTELSLHRTTDSRTVSYASPEALVGVVGKASDWWSVGVMLLELLTGRHPFAGMHEQAINFQLVSKGIVVPNEIEEDWKLLLKGLLTVDRENRWGVEQVRRWLEGDRSMSVGYGSTPKQGESGKRHDYRPYQFGGKEYYEPKELAVALGEDWPNGVKNFGRGFLTDWIKNDVRNAEWTDRLKDVAEDRALNASQRLSIAIMILDPDVPLRDELGEVSPESLKARDTEIRGILIGELGRWLKELRGEDWLFEVKKELLWLVEGTAECIEKLDDSSVDELLLLDKRELAGKWKKFRDEYGGSSISHLDKIFNAKSWGRPEKLVLLSLPRKMLKTHEQILQERYDNTSISVKCPNLEAVLRMKLVDPDRDLIRKDLASQTTLVAYLNQITGLNGLEYATDLTELELSFNQITDVKPLAKLVQLKELNLDRNQITDVSPLANLTELTYLNVAMNQIKDLSPLASLANLRILRINHNPMESDDVRKLRKTLPKCKICF